MGDERPYWETTPHFKNGPPPPRGIQQAARVAAQIENQSFEGGFVHRAQGVIEFPGGGLIELLDMDVADAGANEEMRWDAGAVDGVADEVENQRLRFAFAVDLHLYGGAAGALQQIGHLGGIQAQSALVVDLEDNVAGPQAGLEGGRTRERIDHHGVTAARLNGHPDTIVAAALIFA